MASALDWTFEHCLNEKWGRKVGSKEIGKGGSEVRRDPNTQTLLEQARLFANSQGIRLLPSSCFELSSKNRKELAHRLGRNPNDIKSFLDEVETHASQYATKKSQREGALSPRDLREELLIIQKHAIHILTRLRGLGVLKESYSPSGEDVKTILYLEVKGKSGTTSDFLKGLIGNLVNLVESIDSSTSNDSEAPDKKPSSKDLDVSLGRNPFQGFIEFLEKESRSRVIPKDGQPTKSIERKMIRDIAIAYERHLGNLPPKAKKSGFTRFIAHLISLTSSDTKTSKCEKLVESVLSDL